MQLEGELINNRDNSSKDQEKNNHPSIYVASLSDYNNGFLHGRWIRADQNVLGISSAIAEMLKESPEYPAAEEYAIHDFEYFGPIRLSEYEDIETVAAVGQMIGKYGEAFAIWANMVGLEEAAKENAEEDFTNSYRGLYESEESYVREYWREIGLEREIESIIPEHLLGYINIDYEMLSKDIDVIFANSQQSEGVHAFWV
ncbi:antirestriction protein ArdA [Ruminococcaceae bacterium OttesenSCG-928-A11]|nr:antirestriction protein ArdA [Ruminococcaceae bacterium OttesenSCG-928-A11]